MTLGRRVLLFASAIALALVRPSTPTRAQSLTGAISGTVADAQGGMLPGADVTLTNQDSKTVQRTVTNSDGVFVFASVPAGTYCVRVELSELHGLGGDRHRRCCLGAAPHRHRHQAEGRRRSRKSISVTSRPDIAPIDSGEKSARLTAEQIQNVPMVGRSTGELLKLLPGMTPISGEHQQQPGLQRRSHRHQRQRRRRQTERGRQLLGQRHARRRARHRHRRRPRLRPGLQLRHVGQPEPRHGRRVQGAAVELRRRARQGPDHHRRRSARPAAVTSTAWATSTCATTAGTPTSGA